MSGGINGRNFYNNVVSKTVDALSESGNKSLACSLLMNINKVLKDRMAIAAKFKEQKEHFDNHIPDDPTDAYNDIYASLFTYLKTNNKDDIAGLFEKASELVSDATTNMMGDNVTFWARCQDGEVVAHDGHAYTVLCESWAFCDAECRHLYRAIKVIRDVINA